MAIVKPVVLRMFKIKSEDIDTFFQEAKGKLLEETDYDNELKQGVEAGKLMDIIPNLKVPKYYPEFSNDKMIAMEWVEGHRNFSLAISNFH